MASVSRQECRSSGVEPRTVSEAAELLYEAFVKDEKYGPVDKLGLASSPDSLLVALFEVERGVRSSVDNVEGKGSWRSFVSVAEAIAGDARNPRCLEHAIRLAHELAVKALAKTSRR